MNISNFRKRLFVLVAVSGLTASFTSGCVRGSNGAPCASHSDCSPAKDAQTNRLCYGCSEEDVCFYEGFPASYVCSSEEAGEPTGEEFSGSVNDWDDGQGTGEPGGSSSGSDDGPQLACDSNSFRPYDEPQVDSQCQTACIYSNGGYRDECTATCELYETVAASIASGPIRRCPACPCP